MSPPTSVHLESDMEASNEAQMEIIALSQRPKCPVASDNCGRIGKYSAITDRD